MAQSAPQTWQTQPRAAADLVQLQGIIILPATQVQRHIANGGPVWPHAADTLLRHCRDGMAVDIPPEPPAHEPSQHLPRAVWGGFLDMHFGHFVAEHLSRVAHSAAQMPDEAFLFTVDPAVGQGDLPSWMWEVLAHVGVTRSQVHLLRAPVLVDRLFACPQAEMLPQVAPSPAYLDILDGLGARVQPIVQDLVYVSRAALPALGGGGTAGEGYVETLLRGAGVQVLDPARASIADQMATYAGARHLVFAEGSALHGRQLLGRIPQRITVLRRRRGRNMARAMLAPRVAELRYADVTAASLVPQWKKRRAAPRPRPCAV